MYEKLSNAYGLADNGTFYDLGCGVGQLVYTAAMINLNKFDRCGGIDIISNLLDRGVKRMTRWDNIVKMNFPKEVRSIQFLWNNEDMYKNQNWLDATFIIIHWTAFSNIQIKEMSALFYQCNEGTQIITITHPIQMDLDRENENPFELLIKDVCVTSWGNADFYFYEKLTPSKVL